MTVHYARCQPHSDESVPQFTAVIDRFALGATYTAGRKAARIRLPTSTSSQEFGEFFYPISVKKLRTIGSGSS